jgi:transcriptional regulator with XRE-family HTH domain
MTEIGKQIRRLRELRHLTQGELALLCGIPQSGMARIEGRSNLTIKTLQRVAKALKVKLVVQFVHESDSQPSLPMAPSCTTAALVLGNNGMRPSEREIKRLAASITKQLSKELSTERNY